MIIAISEKANLSNFRSNVGEYDQISGLLTLWYSSTHLDSAGIYHLNDFDMPKGVKLIRMVDNDFGHRFTLKPRELKKFKSGDQYLFDIAACLEKYGNVKVDKAQFGTTTASAQRDKD